MRRIYINGRFLVQKITGVQRYATETIKALDKLIGEDMELQKTYCEILLPKTAERYCYVSLQHIRMKQVGRLSGHLWEQIELPYYSRKGFLLNLCNCAPLIKKNQMVAFHDAAVCGVPETFSFIFRWWYKMMFRFLGYRLQNILTVSKFSKEELHKYFSIHLNKIHVTYNGIEHINRITPDNRILGKHHLKQKKYVLAVSSINPSKNFKLILHAAQKEKLKDKKFVIAGTKNTKIFKEEATNIPNNVKFIGYVSDEELVALYRNAACFVYPSLYEGFGIPPVEAMACGCPVIVSNRGSLPEICGDGALYCDACNSEDLADKIDSLLSNEPLCAELIPKAYNIAEKYTWESVARKILAQEW